MIYISAVGLIFILALIISCSNPNENQNGSINITKSIGSLIITNTTPETIYYMVVEVEFASRINWAPGFDHPSVEEGELTEIRYDEVYKEAGEKLQTGDKVIIFWWTNDHNTPSVINSVSLTI